MPGWAQDGGNAKMLGRLKVKDDRLLADIAAEMERRGGPNCVGISSTLGHMTELDEKFMDEIAKLYNLPAEEAVVKVLLGCEGGTLAIYHSLNKDDVLNIMKDMYISVGSDGCVFNYDLDFNPHPRSFGTFPRYLQTVREYSLMPIEDAVYKMTGIPASIIHLPDRGIIKVVNVANITVFDYEEVEDRSSFINSHVKPKGIMHVFVSGVPSIINGIQTDNRAGKIILKDDYNREKLK